MTFLERIFRLLCNKIPWFLNQNLFLVNWTSGQLYLSHYFLRLLLWETCKTSLNTALLKFDLSDFWVRRIYRCYSCSELSWISYMYIKMSSEHDYKLTSILIADRFTISNPSFLSETKAIIYLNNRQQSIYAVIRFENLTATINYDEDKLLYKNFDLTIIAPSRKYKDLYKTSQFFPLRIQTLFGMFYADLHTAGSSLFMAKYII